MNSTDAPVEPSITPSCGLQVWPQELLDFYLTYVCKPEDRAAYEGQRQRAATCNSPDGRPPLPLANVIRLARWQAIAENILPYIATPHFFTIDDVRSEAAVFFNRIQAMAEGRFRRATTTRDELNRWRAAGAPYVDLLREPHRYDLVDEYLRVSRWRFTDEWADRLFKLAKQGSGAFARWIDEDVFCCATYCQVDKTTPPGENTEEWATNQRRLWWKAFLLRHIIQRWDTFNEDERSMHCRVLATLFEPRNMRQGKRGRAVQQLVGDYHRHVIFQGDDVVPRTTIALQARVRQDVAATAVPLVVGYAYEAQRLKFGDTWIKDGDAIINLIPANLPWLDLWTWFENQMQTAVTAILTNTKYPTAMSHRGEQETDVTEKAAMPKAKIAVYPFLDGGPSDSTGGEDLDSLLTLLADEDEAAQALKLFLARDATPKERQVYALLTAGHSPETAAVVMGCKPATVRVHFHNLLGKAQTFAA